jgi:error-prone DNA polymerase
VIEVAIVRPGPIQGDMVHPYLRRREGREPVTYPKPAFEKVLGKTLGVPLFQEQAMRVAIECAGFSANEADQLRRSMATFKFTGGVSHFRDKLIEGMVANGYDRAFAEKTFSQLEGFGSYGFPESHAASFALIAYASSWMKCHHPEVFCAALLNAQPMGFYAPAQIVRDALEHEVEIRAVDVNYSDWDCTLEPSERGLAVRLGLRMVKGLAGKHAAAIVQHRPFAGIDDLWRRARVPVAALEKIAMADGFAGALGLARRQALWAIGALRDEPLPLFAGMAELAEPEVELAPMATGQEVVEDYGSTGVSLRQHPLAFLREELSKAGYRRCSDLATLPDARRIAVAGLVLVRQRPGSASGVMFITIEDEAGIANLVVWPSLFEQYRRVVLSARMIGVEGRVQCQGEVIHLVAERLVDLGELLRSVGERDQPAAGGDELGRKPRDIYIPDLRLGSGIKVPTRDFR